MEEDNNITNENMRSDRERSETIGERSRTVAAPLGTIKARFQNTAVLTERRRSISNDAVAHQRLTRQGRKPERNKKRWKKTFAAMTIIATKYACAVQVKTVVTLI